MTKINDVHKTLEDIDKAFIAKVGSAGVPLAHVTRDEVDLPEDMAGGVPVDPGFGDPTELAERVRRTRHDGEHHDQDNVLVWNVV